MTEKQLQASIVHAARALGWKDAWTWKSFHSPKGWPDLILARGLHLIVAELKSEKGKVTPEQEAWLAWWREFGADIGRVKCCAPVESPEHLHIRLGARVDVYVWKPADLEAAYRILGSPDFAERAG